MVLYLLAAFPADVVDLSVIVRPAGWLIPLMQELCTCAEAKQKEAWGLRRNQCHPESLPFKGSVQFNKQNR